MRVCADMAVMRLMRGRDGGCGRARSVRGWLHRADPQCVFCDDESVSQCFDHMYQQVRFVSTLLKPHGRQYNPNIQH